MNALKIILVETGIFYLLQLIKVLKLNVLLNLYQILHTKIYNECFNIRLTNFKKELDLQRFQIMHFIFSNINFIMQLKSKFTRIDDVLRFFANIAKPVNILTKIWNIKKDFEKNLARGMIFSKKKKKKKKKKIKFIGNIVVSLNLKLNYFSNKFDKNIVFLLLFFFYFFSCIVVYIIFMQKFVLRLFR